MTMLKYLRMWEICEVRKVLADLVHPCISTSFSRWRNACRDRIHEKTRTWHVDCGSIQPIPIRADIVLFRYTVCRQNQPHIHQTETYGMNQHKTPLTISKVSQCKNTHATAPADETGHIRVLVPSLPLLPPGYQQDNSHVTHVKSLKLTHWVHTRYCTVPCRTLHHTAPNGI